MLNFARGLTLVLLTGWIFTGCHSAKGGAMPYTGGTQTYISTQNSPKTVTVVDTRTEDIIWQLAIPPGKQLTFDFDEGGGDDPARTPDLMRWQVWDSGIVFGRLRNSMTIPQINVLRIDVEIRPAPEYIMSSGEQALRVDEPGDRPAWWSPEGGPMPEDPKGLYNYDD